MPSPDRCTLKKLNQKTNLIKTMAVLGNLIKNSARKYTDNRQSLVQNPD